MSRVQVRVPSVLRDCCQGASELTLSAPTVSGVLAELERCYPALYRSVCDDAGRVRRHVNVFVNVSDIRDREGIATILAPGDVVTILPAVSGG